MTKNLTEGKELPLILSFMVPLLCGMLFQQFYNITDTVIVGKFLGKGAMAATGATGSVTFLIIGFANGLASGFAIPVSQRFGARDEAGVRRYAGNAIVIGAAFSVVFAVASVLLCRQILTWMKTPDDIFEYAYAYLVVLLGGIPATLFYNLLSGFIRALGDSRTPVLILAAASVVNVVVTAALVICTPTGVAGAAIATLVSQIISCVLSVIHIVRRVPLLHLSRQDLLPSRPHVSVLCANGIPMGLQYSITAIGSVVLQSAVNSLGSDAVAATTTANKIFGLFASFFDAEGSTMATWGGQHVGAGKIRRIGSGVRLSLIMGCLYSVLCMGIYWFFGEPLAQLFLDSGETAVIESARTMMVLVSLFYPLLTAVNVVRNVIQGMGFGQLAMTAGLLELIGRTAVAFVLVPAFGFVGACFASPAAWLLADGFLLPAFLHCYKTTKAMHARMPPSSEAENER